MSKGWLAVALAGAISLTACTGPSSPTPTPPESHSPLPSGYAGGPTDDPGFRKPPAPPIAGAKAGGTLTVLSSRPRGRLDPYAVSGVAASLESGLLIRSLTQYVYDPRTRSTLLVPDLATNTGSNNADFTVWKFIPRASVRYASGAPVTVPEIVRGVQHGLRAGPYPQAGVSFDGESIVIRLRRLAPDLPYWVSSPSTGPRPTAARPRSFVSHPWATGPYMVKRGSLRSGRSLLLVHNRYWSADLDPGRHRYLDRVDLHFDVPSARIQAVLLADKGSAQTTVDLDPMSSSFYARLTASDRQRLVTGPNGCTFAWYPDNRTITDVAVRRALGWAFPYRAVWRAEGVIPDVTREAGTNLIPPGTPGRLTFNPLPGHTPGEADPAKAREILADAEELGFPIRFAFAADNPRSVAVKGVEVRALQLAGFSPRPIATTMTQYGKEFLNNAKARINLRSAVWCAPIPSGLVTLEAQLATHPEEGRLAGADYAGFSSHYFDERASAIELMPRAVQPAAWNALDKRVQTVDFPIVVTGNGLTSMMRGSRVRDLNLCGPSGMPTWQDLWLAP